MQSFKDNAARPWVVSIDYGTIRRVRELCGVDFLRVFEDGLATALYTDLVKLIDVLGAVLKPALDARAITFDVFADSIAGDVAEDAYNALFGAVADFFPSARRDVILQALAAIRQAAGTAIDQAKAGIQAAGAAQATGQTKPPSEPASKSSPTSSAAPEPAASSPAA